MQIQNYKQNFTPQFKALHIADAGDLSLYKITDLSDKKYIKNLSEKIKIKELMPNLGKDESDRWQEMLEYAVDNAQYPENITYLETHNNKPCGIITFRTENKTTFLDCICTFPTEIGKKVSLAGKTLFYQMFKDIQNIRNSRLELEAITNGPIDVVSKYEDLGFKKTSRVFPTKVVMEINSSKIKETLRKLTELVDYKPVTPEKINLNNTLD